MAGRAAERVRVLQQRIRVEAARAEEALHRRRRESDDRLAARHDGPQLCVWSDDGSVVKVYVPIPGVVREQVTVDIREDALDLHAQTPLYGAFTMALRRIYARIDVSRSSFKVLEKKEKVIITLAKPESQRIAEGGADGFKPWYRLHHDVTNNIDTVEEFESARMTRASNMNAAPQMPKLPERDTKRR